MNAISMRLPDDVLRELDQRAAKLNLSRTEYVRAAVRAMNQAVDFADAYPRPRDYYAAQGNATRLFFRGESRDWLAGWSVAHAKVFSAFSYLLSGGYSKPAMYPAAMLGTMRSFDTALSCCPSLFGGRCLVELRKQ